MVHKDYFRDNRRREACKYSTLPNYHRCFSDGLDSHCKMKNHNEHEVRGGRDLHVMPARRSSARTVADGCGRVRLGGHGSLRLGRGASRSRSGRLRLQVALPARKHHPGCSPSNSTKQTDPSASRGGGLSQKLAVACRLAILVSGMQQQATMAAAVDAADHFFARLPAGSIATDAEGRTTTSG